MKSKLRPLGKITTDLEPLLYELVEGHELQLHEVFGILHAWASVHYPNSIEIYLDNSSPVLKGVNYGPK